MAAIFYLANMASMTAPRRPVIDTGRIDAARIDAARIVSRKRKRDHITPVLYDLHWLPVRDRISFKLLTIAYKCKHNDTPMYLQNIISSHLPTRNLRSSSKHTFTPLVTSTKTYGHRAFPVCHTKTMEQSSRVSKTLSFTTSV